MTQGAKVLLTGLLLAFLPLVFAAGAARAQDPVKVSPDNYKVLFENDQVRVLEMRLAPGEQDVMHSHPSEVVYFVNATKATLTLPDGGSADAEFKAGQVLRHEGWTHTVKNVGTVELLAIIVELKEQRGE